MFMHTPRDISFVDRYYSIDFSDIRVIFLLISKHFQHKMKSHFEKPYGVLFTILKQ